MGLSTAKGLSISLGIPLVAVNTLEIEAEPYRSMGMPVCAVLDAGRSEVSAAMYADEDGQWRNVQEARVLSTEELCSEIDSTTFFCGEALPLVAEALQASLGDKAVLADQTPPTRSPGTLARMGHERFAKGELADVSTLEPFYLRKPSITEPRSPR